jgi:subtilisin family serine protease
MLRILALLLIISSAAAAAPSNYLIVAQGNDTSGALAAVVANGGTVVDDLSAIGAVIATADNADFAAAVAASPGVLSADLDPDIQWIPDGEQGTGMFDDPSAQGVNTEPFASFQWNLRQIHADQTAAAGQLGDGAVVAVIDTGVNTGHKDLRDRIDFARSKAFVKSVLFPAFPAYEDDVFHGSHVSCIVAASINNFGVQGVAPKATIVAIKVLNNKGRGSFGNVIRGIMYASSLGVDVINMSLGATFDRINAGGNGGGGPANSLGHFLAVLTRAVNHASSAGVLVVSAAGNNGVDLNGRLFSVPAQSGNGWAVSATGPVGLQNFDRLASYSNFGASVINVAAPGGDFTPSLGANAKFDLVLSCGNRDPARPATVVNRFFFAAGTSMATPHAAGVAALLVGKLGHVGPAHLRELIGNSAAHVLPTNFEGRGRVDAAAALQ